MKFNFVIESILKKHIIFEAAGKTIVVFPGGFHPFHLGHKSIFDNIQKTFPGADSYIAITDYTEERPFTAEEKKLIILSTGIEPSKVIQVKSPFRPEEILKKYNPKTDNVIFAVGEKEKYDPSRKSLFIRTKKDGSPSYFQDYVPGKPLESFDKHGYIYLFPTMRFGKDVFGSNIQSASELRKKYNSLNNNQKINLIKKLYVKNVDKIKKIFDLHLSNEESDESPEIAKELMKDKDKSFNDVYLNPPYKVDSQLTVGRMKY